MFETVRCKLTPPKSVDLKCIIRLNTDPDVRRFLGGPVEEEAIQSAFSRYIESGNKNRFWVIRLKQNNAFIGIISLETHHNGIDTEVSYMLLPEWWGQGYAQETVQPVINYALSGIGLPRIIAETQVANVASCRLLERLGMQLEGTLERFGAQQAIYATNITPKERPPYA